MDDIDLDIDEELVSDGELPELEATTDPIDIALEGEPVHRPERLPEELPRGRLKFATGRYAKGIDATVIEKLCQALSAGNYPDASCIYAGMTKSTYQRIFQNAAKRPKSQWATAARKIEYAMAQAEVRIVAQWQQHMPKSWQACSAFLAQRYADRWAPVKGSGDSKLPQPINISVNQAMQTVSSMQNAGVLGTTEGRMALLELVQNLTPEQETEILGEYQRLQEAAGLLTEGSGK
jgi:hypothetical protein